MAAVTKAISERIEALLAKGGDVSIAADGTITITQKDGEPATPSMRTLGIGAKQACAGNDSRFGVAGVVGKLGEKVAGSGFSAEKTGTGKYTIKLTTELSTTGVCLVTCAQKETGLFGVCNESGKKEFKVLIFNTGNSLEDGQFHFVIKPV
jgi:hypothetical protein